MASSPKELLLGSCEFLFHALNHVAFNLTLLGATTCHMILQATRTNDSDPTGWLVFVQDAADFYMIWIYTGVLLLRIMARGLIFNPDAFLRNAWCCLDLAIVILAWLNKVYNFGNLMFFMVTRVAKLLMESRNAYVSAPRVIVSAMAAGMNRVIVVFGILLFFMVFFGVLAIQLIGMPGDFHNRCGVSVCTEWDKSGGCLVESWQAIRPAYICRQSKNPLETPAGSCPEDLKFRQLDYTVESNNMEAAALVMNNDPVTLRCLGPNLVTGSFDPQKIKFSKFEGLPAFTEYVPVNYTQWEAVNPFNYDNLQVASIAMFALFYRTSWVQFMETTLESTHFAVAFAYIIILIAVSYYLLNLTVGIMCLNFSESIKRERAMAGTGGGDEDDEDEEDEEDEGEDEDDDSQAGVEEDGMRKKLLDALDSGPCLGNACWPVHHVVPIWCLIIEKIAEIIITKVPIIKLLNNVKPFKDGVKNAYLGIGKCLRACCISLNKLCVVLVIPEEEGKNTPFNKVTLVFMVLYLFALAAQHDDINKYKCGCANIDDLTFAKRCAIGPKLSPEPVVAGQDPRCPEQQACFAGYCTSAWSGVACTNPFANPLTKGLPVSEQSMTDSADEWMRTRSYWCSYGLYLHYVLLGWGGFFAMELVIRYVGHQGALNFFTAKSQYVKKYPEEPVPKSFVPKTIPNHSNILDTVCILLTVAGIALTEFTLGVQVLNANISLMKTSGEDDWSFFTATGPRQVRQTCPAPLL